MNQHEMLAEFQRHRDAEIRRDLDLATLCEQVGFPVDAVRAAAQERAAPTP